MPLEFRLDSLTFSDGTTVPIGAGSVTVLVGPNNAGKSLTLREIVAGVSSVPGYPEPQTVILTAVATYKTGNASALTEWLSENAYESPAPGLVEPQCSRAGVGAVALSELHRLWTTDGAFGQLAAFFVAHAGGEQRLGLAGLCNRTT